MKVCFAPTHSFGIAILVVLLSFLVSSLAEKKTTELLKTRQPHYLSKCGGIGENALKNWILCCRSCRTYKKVFVIHRYKADSNSRLLSALTCLTMFGPA